MTLRAGGAPSVIQRAFSFSTVAADIQNLITNPGGASGLVPGSPGTQPTGWNIGGDGGGLTRTLSGPFTINGIPCFDVRYQGTMAAGGTRGVNAPAVTASPGQRVAAGLFAQLVGGSLTGVTNFVQLNARLGTTFVSSVGSTAFVPSSAPLWQNHIDINTVLPAAGVDNWRTNFMYTFAAGVAVDITLRFGYAQGEHVSNSYDLVTPLTTPIGGARAGWSALYGARRLTPLTGTVLARAQDGAAQIALVASAVVGNLNASIGQIVVSATGTVGTGAAVASLDSGIGDVAVDAAASAVSSATLNLGIGDIGVAAAASAVATAVVDAGIGQLTITATATAGVAPTTAALDSGIGAVEVTAAASAAVGATVSASIGSFVIEAAATAEQPTAQLVGSVGDVALSAAAGAQVLAALDAQLGFAVFATAEVAVAGSLDVPLGDIVVDTRTYATPIKLQGYATTQPAVVPAATTQPAVVVQATIRLPGVHTTGVS